MKFKSESDPAPLPSWKKEVLRAFGIKPPEPVEVNILKALMSFRNASSQSNPKEFREDWRFLKYCADNMYKSHSQIFQDLFVQFMLQDKRGGFFVDFGATDGVNMSNSYTLEKTFGWTGILAEPARCWQQNLKNNRNSLIESRCVWNKTGDVLTFKEVVGAAELSTIGHYTESDGHSSARIETGVDYQVETISLNDLLKQHNAPTTIDYLSIDTEGSEFEILQAFDFDAYDIRIITVEHNHTPNREKIYSLLISKGYVRKLEALSLFDDWYVKRDMYDASV
ncbi:MAG: FkbM family methyltransferase [Nitrosomonadales bacterium]|nr:FkbM family methyltransferase [Nitrosomonadales bacterium]